MIKTALKIVTLILVLTGLLCGYIMFFAGNLKYSEEININCNIDTVVALSIDPYNMLKYMDGIESYELISGDHREIGAKWKVVYKNGEVEMEMIETVISKNLPESMTVTWEMSGVVNTVTNRFVKVDNENTQFINDQEFAFKGFMKIMAFLMPGNFKKQTRLYLEAFKTFVEYHE